MLGVLTAGAVVVGGAICLWRWLCPGLPRLSADEAARADAAALTLRRVRGAAYDSANPSHEALLLRLWAALRPTEELEQRKSQQWEQLGFQGQDPATDFRGGGVLALLHLLYFAERDPTAACRIIDEGGWTEERAETMRWYLFAATGINVTGKVCGWVEDGRARHHFAHCPAEAVGEEQVGGGDTADLLSHPAVMASCQLYAAALTRFHAAWLRDQPPVMEMTQYLDTGLGAPETLTRL